MRHPSKDEAKSDAILQTSLDLVIIDVNHESIQQLWGMCYIMHDRCIVPKSMIVGKTNGKN